MPRIFKGIESELRLLLHPCILTGEITDIKVALFTNDPSVAIEFTDRYTIDDNILTLTVPTWAFGTMEDGVINYVIQGMHNDDAFITDRQSNYYLKTPTDYIPEEMPKEVVLGEFTTMIVENGVFEYTPSDVDAWNKATIEVNVPDTNGSYDEGYNQGYEDGQNSVECPEPKLDYKDVTITNNGTTYFRANEDGLDGYDLVSINVDVPTEGGSCSLGEEWVILGQNDAGATYELYASDNGYDGYSKVTIEVENFTADCPMSEIWTAYNLSNRIVNDNISGGEEYVRGTITSIQEVKPQYGNATYVIDDVFKVYRGKWFYAEPFYDENQIQVGDWVIVKGTTQNYNGQAQFKAGSQVVEHKRCEGGGNCDDAYNQGYMSGVNDGYNQGYNDGQANCGGGEGGSCNLITPIIFSETEGNTINAESVEIPTFIYEGNQHYNVWALYMADYDEFKIQIRFQPNNGGYEEPVNIFGCEDTDWDNTTFGARIYMGYIYFRMSRGDVAYPYSDYAWYDVEMGYNSSKRWIIVNGETLLETDHAWFTKPNQNFMIGAINSGGNAFRPFYGKIAATYIEANGSQVWLLPKEEGYMDVYWNDRSFPWVQLNGESNARFESDWLSGDGMKSITWLGKKEAPTKEEVQGQVDQYTRPAVIFEGVTEVFVEEPHKLQTDDLVEATAWISTKDTVNNKWCLWTKEGKYEGVDVLNGSAFGGDYYKAKCIRLTGITKLLSSTFFPISAEEIHFGSIEYIETSAIESMNELKKIFYTGEGNVTIDNNAIRGANPNGTLYLKNGVDETPWLERLPEGWVVERLNDDGSVNVNVAPKINVYECGLKFAYSSFDAIPECFDFKNVEDMYRMFQSCTNLAEVRMIDTSSVTNMSNCFYSCSNLKQIATLDTSNVTNMEAMCNYCGQLITFPPLNTSKVTNMREMFRNCNNLVSVPPLDARSVVKQSYGIFGSSNFPNLTDFGGLIGLKASMDGNYGFEKCPNLTYESCINILNGLYDFTGNGVTPTSNEGKLKVHSNFLTTVGDEISIGTEKGWTITA